MLYAPGLPDLDAIRTVCAAVSKPVNILANTRIPGLSVAVLAELGAKRISLGGTLSRTILGSLVRAARELRDHGTFGFAQDALPMAEINAFMRRRLKPRRPPPCLPYPEGAFPQAASRIGATQPRAGSERRAAAVATWAAQMPRDIGRQMERADMDLGRPVPRRAERSPPLRARAAISLAGRPVMARVLRRPSPAS